MKNNLNGNTTLKEIISDIDIDYFVDNFNINEDVFESKKTLSINLEKITKFSISGCKQDLQQFINQFNLISLDNKEIQDNDTLIIYNDTYKISNNEVLDVHYTFSDLIGYNNAISFYNNNIKDKIVIKEFSISSEEFNIIKFAKELNLNINNKVTNKTCFVENQFLAIIKNNEFFITDEIKKLNTHFEIDRNYQQAINYYKKWFNKKEFTITGSKQNKERFINLLNLTPIGKYSNEFLNNNTPITIQKSKYGIAVGFIELPINFNSDNLNEFNNAVDYYNKNILNKITVNSCENCLLQNHKDNKKCDLAFVNKSKDRMCRNWKSKDDFKYTKICIENGNLKLFELIKQKLKSLGFSEKENHNNTNANYFIHILIYEHSYTIHKCDSYGFKLDNYTEIFPEDLGIDKIEYEVIGKTKDNYLMYKNESYWFVKNENNQITIEGAKFLKIGDNSIRVFFKEYENAKKYVLELFSKNENLEIGSKIDDYDLLKWCENINCNFEHIYNKEYIILDFQFNENKEPCFVIDNKLYKLKGFNNFLDSLSIKKYWNDISINEEYWKVYVKNNNYYLCKTISTIEDKKIESTVWFKRKVSAIEYIFYNSHIEIGKNIYDKNNLECLGKVIGYNYCQPYHEVSIITDLYKNETSFFLNNVVSEFNLIFYNSKLKLKDRNIYIGTKLYDKNTFLLIEKLDEYNYIINNNIIHLFLKSKNQYISINEILSETELKNKFNELLNQ